LLTSISIDLEQIAAEGYTANRMYPPDYMTKAETTFTTASYANGQYMASASSAFVASMSGYKVFDNSSSTVWHSATTYNGTTGVILVLFLRLRNQEALIEGNIWNCSYQ
jgi:hypothetical protein